MKAKNIKVEHQIGDDEIFPPISTIVSFDIFQG